MGLFEPLPLHHAARAFNVQDSPYNASGDGLHDDTGALLSAVAAAKADGGGTIWLPHGTYPLATSIALDGSVPIAFCGDAPAGYDGGAILQYTGADWAIKSTASSYPSGQGKGALTAFQNLTVQCLGANYLGGIYANYLPVEFRGVVNVRGDATQNPSVGTGVQISPGANQRASRADNLWIGEFSWGLVLENDEFHADHLMILNTYARALSLGLTQSMIECSIGSLCVANTLSNAHSAILVTQPAQIAIASMNIQGTGILSAVQFLAAAEGQLLIPHVGTLSASGVNGGFTLRSGQYAPCFERMDYPSWAGAGFGLATPAVPGGTGSGNAVQNTTGGRVRVYQTGMVGTHIIDWLGNDKALGVDPPVIELECGGKVYYATTKASSWVWEQVH